MRRQQHGIALITAIILVALAAVLATAIGFASAMAARRATTSFGADQAFLAAQGVEAMAAYILKQTYAGNTSNSAISLDQPWAQPYGPYELSDGITLDLAQIEDEQGKFNLNNLARSNGHTDEQSPDFVVFQRLLKLVLGDSDEKWAGLIADWIDIDGTPNTPDGAEDSVYLSQTPPYRPPNLYISSISELLALPGFGRDRYDRLAPYITALPVTQTINICTASAFLLDAIADQTSYSLDPAALANERKEAKGCFPTPDAFKRGMQQEAVSAQGLVDTTTSYFRLRTFITIGTARFTLYSLMYHDPNTMLARPILRTFGTE
ncbi:MAG TPA: type II secretion system minor pseudopilin GspK [Steroidobacteraceae bacterium]|jgi:general secretion pathway protein K|nr:type II secretion system minor pseudopilin GspK [Steroidobacteraceae bacterium]